MSNRRPRNVAPVAVVLVAALTWSCVRNLAPVEPQATAPPPGADRVAPAPSLPSPPPLPNNPSQAPPLSPEDEFASRSLEDLNRESPLEPVFFAYDSTDLDADARSILETNVEVLQRYPTWVITIEGHCDERGTPEYNLGLGERRALATREYLVGLGLPIGRLRTVSYGKEFPFNPGHDDRAWALNRRAHFVITAR